MSVCIPTYMLASGLIAGGMSWWQAIGTILIGNLIVLVPMLLNAHAGARYGIPFPVFVRASFGVRGANVPAVLRALVAKRAARRIIAVLHPIANSSGDPLPTFPAKYGSAPINRHSSTNSCVPKLLSSV